MRSRRDLGAAIAATLVVAAAVIAAITTTGGFAAQRQLRRDEQIADKLSTLTRMLLNRGRLNRGLPDDLREFGDAGINPVTGKQFEYHVVNASIYRLCATFERAGEQPYPEFRTHRAGYQCFEKSTF